MKNGLFQAIANALPPIASLQRQRNLHAFRADQAEAELAAAKRELVDALARLAEIPPSVPPPAPTPTHPFSGYDIPVDLMYLTGGGPETFDAISRAHTDNLRRFVGLEPQHTLVEIGCGIGRDAIPLSGILIQGKYVGIDIIKRSIDWCSENISKRHPNFKFYHYDVADRLHNAAGNTKTLDIYLPLPDSSVDRIILFSVFTHMMQADIEHYLREFHRVLKPSGLVYATTFIYDDAILAAARRTNLTPFDLRFEHEAGSGCRINDPVHPLGAVAFTQARWDEMLRASDMRATQPFLHGAWAGYHADPKDGQDVGILARAD